jgi:hypothetical protein
MVARCWGIVWLAVPFTPFNHHEITGDAGDHKGPPIHPSSALAPTDVDELCVRLMPLGRPLRSPSSSIVNEADFTISTPVHC